MNDRSDATAAGGGGTPDAAAKEAKPSPDTDGQGEADRKRTGLNLLLGYLVFHLAVLAFLSLYPLFLVIGDPLARVQADGFLGHVYLDLLQMDIHKIGGWVVAALSGVVSATTLWRSEMSSKRRWLMRTCLAGLAVALLYYIVLIWMNLGVNLWQCPDCPSLTEFKNSVATFTFRNCAVFGAALLGALGAQLPDLIRGRTP